VDPESRNLGARKLLRELTAQGRYKASTAEIVRGLGVSDVAARAALHRLKEKGEIATPCRAIHPFLPPEYQALGCLPPEQCVAQLMERLSVAHYAGFLAQEGRDEGNEGRYFPRVNPDSKRPAARRLAREWAARGR